MSNCQVEVECLLCSREYFKKYRQLKNLKKKRRKMQKGFVQIENLLIEKPPHYQEKIIGICEQYRGRY